MNSVQVPLGAIAVVQGHVRLGKVGTTQNARQRRNHQDVKLELDNKELDKDNKDNKDMCGSECKTTGR